MSIVMVLVLFLVLAKQTCLSKTEGRVKIKTRQIPIIKCIAIVCFIVFMANTHLQRTSANKSERAFQNIIIFTSLLCATFPEKSVEPHQQNHSPPIYYFSQHLRSNILSFNIRSFCFWFFIRRSSIATVAAISPILFGRIVSIVQPSYPFRFFVSSLADVTCHGIFHMDFRHVLLYFFSTFFFGSNMIPILKEKG